MAFGNCICAATQGFISRPVSHSVERRHGLYDRPNAALAISVAKWLPMPSRDSDLESFIVKLMWWVADKMHGRDDAVSLTMFLSNYASIKSSRVNITQLIKD